MYMPEEDIVLAKRILRDLNSIFDRERNLLEFEIIPVEDKVLNKSPVCLEDQRLGLESWATQYLFAYCYTEFMKCRSNQIRSDNATINELTRSILLINPDIKTAWNCRKQLVTDSFVDVIDELRLSSLIAKRRQKCLENFFHRQWLVQFYESVYGFPDENFVNAELDLCYEAARRYQSNYYAWDHRRWIITTYSYNLTTCGSELASTKSWIERHISDYSGFSYRQFIMVAVGKLFLGIKDTRTAHSDYSKLLLNDMAFVDDLMRIHCNRESLFLHRRFVITQILSFDKTQERQLYEREKRLVYDYIRIGRDKILIDRHVKWLQHNLKWEF